MSRLLQLRDRRWLLSSIILSLLVAGCGPSRPKTYPVSGTVTLDGKPIAGACVMLEPKDGGRTARGTTDQQGHFTIGTFEKADGALPGEHFVSVTKSEMKGVQADPDGLSGPVDPGGVKEVWIIPKRFSDPKNSGLEVEVSADMKPMDLALKSD